MIKMKFKVNMEESKMLLHSMTLKKELILRNMKLRRIRKLMKKRRIERERSTIKRKLKVNMKE